MIILEHSFEGPFSTGCYEVTFPGGRKCKVGGKQASMISLILSGYQFREDFHPLGAFTGESLEPGLAAVKVVTEGNDPG